MKAGLGDHVTLDACCHGGLTELGNAGLTEVEIMSLLMHRTPDASRGYVKRIEVQRLNASMKRRKLVEGVDSGSESKSVLRRVEMKPQLSLNP